MLSVIIPAYKSAEYTDLCLYSIFEGEKEKGKNEIILVLDGFVEESRYLIEKYNNKKNFKVIAFENNQGFQYAVNTGVNNAKSNKIFIANNDNVFPKDWDVILEDSYTPNCVITIQQIEPGVIPVGFNFIAKNFGIDAKTFDYKSFIKFEQNNRKNEISNNGLLFPFLISKIDYMKVGGLDLYYNSLNVCDWDFFLKLELCNIKSYRIHNLALYHFGSKGSKNQDNISEEEKQLFLNKEKLAFEQFYYKWKFMPSRGVNNTLIPNKCEINGIKFK